MAGSIITTTSSPAQSESPQVKFLRSEFDALIWDKGYEVYHDIAMRCPCKEQGADNLSSCKNCGGSGWFWINRNKTKMVLSAMNQETEFKEWSEEHRGTVRITAMEEDRIAFMDRITLIQAEATYTETVYPKLMTIGGNRVLFAYTVYEILSMIDVFLFQTPDQPLRKLELYNDYTIEEDKGKIILNSIYHSLSNPKITVRYKYRPQYYIIDLVRGTMYSDIKNVNSTGAVNVRFPASAIGKLAHYTLEPKNFDGSYLFDNSYQDGRNTCQLP